MKYLRPDGSFGDVAEIPKRTILTPFGKKFCFSGMVLPAFAVAACSAVVLPGMIRSNLVIPKQSIFDAAPLRQEYRVELDRLKALIGDDDPTVEYFMAVTSILGAGTTSYTKPADWNDGANSIECIAAGGKANNSSSTQPKGGGAGAGYAKKNNYSFSGGSATTSIPAAQTTPAANGADCYFDSTSVVLAKGGPAGTGPGAVFASVDNVGDVKFNGGNSGGSTIGTSNIGGGGGGGAGGPNGGGVNGSDRSGQNGGNGGSGGNNSGGSGGNGASGVGVSGAAGNPGGDMAGGSAGSGGGGGGGGGYSSSETGGGGGAYGAGSGGPGSGPAGGSSGNSGAGVIVVTYTPIAGAAAFLNQPGIGA